ncbi:MAG: hypothetical protein P1P84_11030 [Deferrisomatales bacterium]|nr:hypothetical protein [Deferrisomatales bacterium]
MREAKPATDPGGPWRRRLRLALLALVLGGVPAAAADPCLECHGQIGFGVAGHSQWLHPEALAAGVHGRLACADCHKGADGFPHGDELRLRCDLRCHVPGAGHGPVAEAVAGGVHAGIGAPPCVACHDGTAAPERVRRSERCLACHPGLEPEREVYPDSPGAFGFHAHRSVPADRRAPDCVDCHGAHSVGDGAAARGACAAAACHPQEGKAFGALFDHRAEGRARPWGGAGGAAAALIGLCAAVLALHSLRG